MKLIEFPLNYLKFIIQRNTRTAMDIKNQVRFFRIFFRVLQAVIMTTSSVAFSSVPFIQADLRADVNRDGEIYTGHDHIGRDDKQAQSYWTLQRGAIVLPNLDDDGNRCDETATIQELSVTACNDSKDTVINGKEDFLDLAPIRLMPWREAPNNATAVIRIKTEAKNKARLFIQKDKKWRLLPSNNRLTAQDLREGVNLRLEALDVVRDKRLWDGRIDVIATVKAGSAQSIDRVQFHVAPLILQTDLMRLKKLYLPGMPWGQDEPLPLRQALASSTLLHTESLKANDTVFGYLSILDAAQPTGNLMSQSLVPESLGLLGSAFQAFRDDFAWGLKRAQPSGRINDLSTFEDPWAQDIFEMAYASMPKPSGKAQIISIALRSAQPQRSSALLPLSEVLGRNVGIVEQWTSDSEFLPENGDYSLNSTGNFGTIPPYSHRGNQYPFGRILYGAGKAWMATGGGIIDTVAPETLELVDRFPDASFVRMLVDQNMQRPVVIDTTWLAVGHIDEIVAFVPADNRRGWKVVVADPKTAWKLLSSLVDKGYGDTKFLSGLERWASGIDPDQLNRTVKNVVNDARLKKAQIAAQIKIAGVINALKGEIGITDADIIRVPVLFEPTYFNNQSYVALTPNAANLVVLSKNTVAVAKQHGPLVKGIDIFNEAVKDAFESADLTVAWVEDYIQAHGGSGEIHCQSNFLRDPGKSARWWDWGHRPLKHSIE
jgi:protein-arginine deiminase